MPPFYRPPSSLKRTRLASSRAQAEEHSSAETVQFVHHGRPSCDRIDFAANPVQVYVGSDKVRYELPKDVLVANSSFFSKALQANWKEGQTNVVSLPQIRSHEFNIYTNWLMRRVITIERPQTSPKSSAYLQEIVLAYTLGEVLLDNDFKDAVSDVFVKILFTPFDGTVIVPGSTLIALIYETTLPNSKLRQLLVQRVCATNQHKFSPSDNPEFLCDTIQYLLGDTITQKSFLSAVANCHFHEHASGEKNCYREKYRFGRELVIETPMLERLAC